MQKVYIEQETQTETQSGLKSQEQIETESEHSFYEGPFYLMFGPQKQLLLVSANEIKQNSQNFHGIQINPKQDELQKQGKKTYKLSQKQPKMIDYLVKRNTNYSNTNQQMPPKAFQPSIKSPIQQTEVQKQQQQNHQQFENQLSSAASGHKLPILVTCLFCQQVGQTQTKYVANSKTYFYSLILCLTLPFLVCLPYYVDDCQQAMSHCQNCGNQVATAD